jgi:F-type H+-transporting ATPase subunit gamma
MAELTIIQKRLSSLGALRELIGALRSMAASRSREAHDSLAGTRAYRRIVKSAIVDLKAAESGLSSPERTEGAVLLVTSENGFVGSFNHRVISRALEVGAPDDRVFIVGKRGQLIAQEMDVRADGLFAMSSRVSGVAQLAERIAERLASYRRVCIVFAKYKSGASFEIVDRVVLPLSPDFSGESVKPFPPLHQLSVDRLTNLLATEYLFAEICDSLVESLASENGARLQTMTSASRNIDDRLERLTREARSASQERTTSDMLEIVAGAEVSRSP